MDDLEKYFNKQMETDPDFKAKYEKTRPEYEVMKALIKARIDQNLSQKQLSEKSGIRQSNISRIENGTCSPTVATLQALAKGMGKELVIQFK